MPVPDLVVKESQHFRFRNKKDSERGRAKHIPKQLLDLTSDFLLTCYGYFKMQLTRQRLKLAFSLFNY